MFECEPSDEPELSYRILPSNSMMLGIDSLTHKIPNGRFLAKVSLFLAFFVARAAHQKKHSQTDADVQTE
jgi:hypothetical protein